MSKLIIVLLASLGGLAGLAATAGSAHSQVYVDDYADFYVGDRVHVYAHGGWYSATVLDISGSSVLVRYIDSPHEEWVDFSRVSLTGSTVGVVYQPLVRVYWGDGWYDGTLLRRRGNRYQVRYHGRTEWIGAERWHHRHHRHATYHRAHHGSHYRNVRYSPRPQVRTHDYRHDRADRGDRRNRDDGRGRGRGNNHRH